MVTRSSRSKKLRRWRISRIRGSPAEFVGYMDAADDATAIKNTIEEFGITDPEKKKRLAAQRVKSGRGEDQAIQLVNTPDDAKRS
jgi:hypothetical protein